MDTSLLADTDYPLLNIFWTMLELFLWVLWFFLLFKIITDIFRSHDLSGWGKAGWLVLVILLPLIGVLVYLIARGESMTKRDIEQAQETQAAFKAYVRDAAASAPDTGGGGRSHVDDLAKLAALKDKGAITEEEYQQAKAKILA
ncbi:phospholipase D-like protein [Streptomyces sp. 1114.5]|uniref:SHOCT domain-containing protein n=1 Tax=unclassified Streptomyces TaxID=2593676 RepID=UPI000BCECE78|nr:MULTISPECIES: SHOCT domain-containing protein [unclassified Streptomyces]RKT18636.1 phospholipase D-like protein [Streptomyces sp. 1114.5]SOB84838.1 Phospholipase_D-nuclease N-terminal [Streptomyces sp. 1331.2]